MSRVAHADGLGHRPDIRASGAHVLSRFIVSVEQPMRFAVAVLFALAAVAPANPAFAATDDGVARPIHRVEPEFPRWAFRAGADHGVVTARLTVDSDGKVSHVEIVKAEPKRLFDDAVVQAVSQWRYADGRAARTIDVEIAFNR
jgi:protein TonB